MRSLAKHVILAVFFLGVWVATAEVSRAEVKAWKGTITIPTYPWEDDVNPKFWALEGGPKLSTTVRGSIIYPYTMQDHLSRTKVERAYKALFLENEYLKVVCLPELGGRLHSVLDKTTGEEMFHLNRVIKPGMIAMRGAWISGGVEWNPGPHGHTVTCVSPVDALVGHNADGSAFLEISNQEKIFRTRWTVRVTLHPGRSYLEERIRLYNPTDGMHPYYFWNCTAFPCRDGTRFIYPMSLGTDHAGRKFFNWPVHEGKDLSWLKNYEIYASVFAVDCRYDFFGAYDVDADRGIVQVANHHVLPGKKAWTWGTWDFGLVAQQSLTDEDGPYIEVQSGPLPTQSDYGMLSPRQEIAWEEWWYPVHALGDGFEYATKDVAIQTSRTGGQFHLRLLATGEFPRATCRLSRKGQTLREEKVDLSPQGIRLVTLSGVGDPPVEVSVEAEDGQPLASFTSPLPIPKSAPRRRPPFEDTPDEQLTAEEKYLKGWKYDRDTNRREARRYYELALADDPGHVDSLRAVAVLDLEAGLYGDAVRRLETAVQRNPDDGLSWYFLGVCHLRLANDEEALRCGYQAARCFETTALGYDLAGRAAMRLRKFSEADEAFGAARRHNLRDRRARDHWLLARYAAGDLDVALSHAGRSIAREPSEPVLRALPAIGSKEAMGRFVREARASLGEYDFNMIETSLVFAELGLYEQAAELLRAACVDTVPENQRNPLALYYLAYFASRAGHEEAAEDFLGQAARGYRDFVFASRPEAIPVLQYAIGKNPDDAHAHLQLGNLFAHLGRVDEAVPRWEKAAALNPKLSIAWRNLALAAATGAGDLPRAAECYRKGIAARPSDQTLYRDLAEILIAAGKRPEAIRLLETMPFERMRRADIIVMLAQAYFDEKRYDDTVGLLEATPYFVSWEGQDVTWVLFHKSHVERGRKRLEAGEIEAAIQDFDAALTYPENLGVGRSNRPQEAAAQYWRGKALAKLGRAEQARAAWKEGAAGHEGSEEQNKYRQLCQEALSAAP